MTNHPFLLPVDRVLNLLDEITAQFGLNVPPIVNMDYLRSLPADSFGYAWVKHLDDRNLKPFTRGLRRKQLHDGVHVLTGYDTDAIGEAEVQAFLLGAKFRPVHVLVLGIILLGVQRRRKYQLISATRSQVKECITRAYHRGRESNFEPDTWQPEHLWNHSLRDVQLMFGLQTH
ncbi:Coq4 family protein [Roseofilum casamattae]|uniref:Coq4 family protein n=1 Tax=Roseofilum casamattae BLCC-M143 TaxID=3022442 RepID=A0ABT7C4M6_9CYAN|nr:Coq4 family protein [Roseofilum casamattae]MDJ1185856.1 Coq4 family protein [Roseofilum casamattae BLCC-M143]